MTHPPVDVTHVYAPDSVDGSEGLLLSIYRLRETDDEVADGTHFLTPTDSPLQVAFVTHSDGGVVDPHYHPQHQRTTTGTPEVLVVMGGPYLLDVYTSAGVPVGEYELAEGTIVVIRGGGHGLRCLTDDGVLFEVKLGPYLGALDKVRFTPRGM